MTCLDRALALSYEISIQHLFQALPTLFWKSYSDKKLVIGLRCMANISALDLGYEDIVMQFNSTTFDDAMRRAVIWQGHVNLYSGSVRIS